MPRLTTLTSYSDADGNRIEYEGSLDRNVQIKIEGRHNVLKIHPQARIGRLWVDFNCNNGLVEIGPNRGVPALQANIRVGQDCRVLIGANVSMTSPCAISTAEGTTVQIGDDVMFASENQVRADDGHPIFDVRTGRRVNVSRSITIGDHVWLGRMATVLGGASIGRGTVIGYASVVTRAIPNNCIAAGVPAKVIRRDTAWERPHLTLVEPFYKPDSSTIERSPYWDATETPAASDVRPRTSPSDQARSVVAGLRRRAGRVRRRLVGRPRRRP